MPFGQGREKTFAGGVRVNGESVESEQARQRPADGGLIIDDRDSELRGIHDPDARVPIVER